MFCSFTDELAREIQYHPEYQPVHQEDRSAMKYLRYVVFRFSFSRENGKKKEFISAQGRS
jgi:hypothetical protein